MIIDQSNCEVGRGAMMHAVFFYYQLLNEGGFSSGQTSYWLFEKYTVWEILDIVVNEPKGVSLGIDQTFIREAALIYILCMLENYYCEFEPSEFPTENEKEYMILQQKGLVLIPELSLVLEAIKSTDPILFKNASETIFSKYVRGRFVRLSG